MDDDAEIPLVGGRTAGAVVRKGGTVRKPSGPWTPSVHALLHHLEAAGFAGAPRALGLDERGREVLTFIEGEALGAEQDPSAPPVVGRWPDAWRTDSALAEVGTLLRALHDALDGFVLEDAVWRHHDRPQRPGEIISHGDIAPWNTVFREGRPVAFIDWDSARPVEPLLELGDAAWRFCPLADDEWCAAAGFDEDRDDGRRLRIFCDAYGLANRSVVLDAIDRALQQRVEILPHWHLDAIGAASYLRMVAGDLEWFAARRPALARALAQ